MMFLANNGRGGGGGGGGGGSGGGGGGSNSSGGGSWFSSSSTSKVDPAQQAKEWRRNLQKEMRRLDRDILGIQREEAKAVKEVKALLKKNQPAAAKILARQVVQTRRTTERMHTTKAQMNSVSNGLQTSMSLLKMQGAMSRSAEIMQAMNKLVNVKEMRETMSTMAREMERAGLVEEIVGETLDSMDDAGVEAEADQEVEKIITELTASVLAPAGATPVSRPAAAAATAKPAAAQTPAAQEEESVDEETQELMRRLQAL